LGEPVGSPHRSWLPPVYAILDVECTRRSGRDPLELASIYFDAGIRLLQIRAKEPGGAELLRLARALVRVGSASGAAVVINDRSDIAVLAGAAGVHVGQEDLPPAAVRRLMPEGILGFSTHSREQFEAALDTPATYIAVGPVFGTTTKETGYKAVGLGLVTEAAARAGRPVVAIGGITLDNARSVLDAGAASVAIISDLLKGEPAGRARAFLERLGG
jgi:thiamine-phosphate pyrophosphorylase